MMRRYVTVVLVLLLGVGASAHVGSPNAYYSGKAGPYVIDAVVRPPEVVPGLAQIVVRSDDKRIAKVVVRPIFWRAGAKGAPTGDEATPVKGQTGAYAAELWLMAGGAYSVEVIVSGSAGAGSAMIPVVAVATGQLGLSTFLRILLVTLGTLLLAGVLTAVHAAVGESQVAPGEVISPERKRRARRAVFVAMPILAFVLLGGAKWWGSEAQRYQASRYAPFVTQSKVSDVNGVRSLDLTILDEAWLGVTPILPDHGKLAHMFVVGVEFPFALAHLHPSMPDRRTLRAILPPLPPGKYRVFTDVVHESGFQRTLVDSIRLPEWVTGSGLKQLDGDESWSINERVFVQNFMENKEHEGGLFMRWAGGFPVYAETPGVLKFTTTDIHGDPMVVEPYLGMAGHAVVVREDGKVFIHLHPNGTASMATLAAFDLRNRGDTTRDGRLRTDAMHSMETMTQPDTVRALNFPYAFPSAGRYRVYVQARVKGEVHTTAFDVQVWPKPMTTTR